MSYKPDNLDLWTLPDCYAGPEWPDYYVFLGQHRESDSLTRSNFICGLEAIGGESETVKIIREHHWAVGWVEWIAIHKSDGAALREADQINAALSDYPVVNEDHFSELEWNEACEYWEQMSVRDRAEICKRSGVSIFAARRDYIPEDPNGAVFETLRGV